MLYYARNWFLSGAVIDGGALLLVRVTFGVSVDLFVRLSVLSFSVVPLSIFIHGGIVCFCVFVKQRKL